MEVGEEEKDKKENLGEMNVSGYAENENNRRRVFPLHFMLIRMFHFELIRSKLRMFIRRYINIRHYDIYNYLSKNNDIRIFECFI